MRRLKHMSKLLLLLGSMFIVTAALAQERTITGKVTDGSTGEMLAGATIVLQGTTTGVTTDLDGNFSITAKDGDVLVVSFIGYLSENITLSGQSTVDVSLILDMQSLEEVVVIGYGTVKKEDITGSVAVVSTEDFNKGAITSAEQLITGKVAGVQVTSGGGEPGSGQTIRIRGGSSLTASNDPLYVIDGVPIQAGGIDGMANPMATINPNDIESMTILKDASATAIYGSRASNGVIIIETKKGKAGAPVRIDYSGKFSFYQNTKTVDVLDTAEFRKSVNEYALIASPSNPSTITNLLDTFNTDWQDEIYTDAMGMDHNLGISGTAGFLPYRISGGYFTQDGTLKTGSVERITLNGAINPKFLDDHLSVNLNAKYSLANNQFAPTGAIGAAVQMDPTKPIQNDTTYWYWGINSASGAYNTNGTRNPVAQLAYTDDHSEVNRFIGNAQFDYKFHFLPELRANLNLGYDMSASEGERIESVEAPWRTDVTGQRGNGSYREYTQDRTNKLLDFYLQYNRELPGIQSRIDAMGGYSYQYFYNESYSFERTITNGENNYQDTLVDPRTRKGELVLLSFFGRINYQLMDKYLLTFTFRNDQSSRFSEDARSGFFPSVALAWDMKKENWLQGASVLSQLKLRGGWGITGQQDIGDNLLPYQPNYLLSTPRASYQFGNQFYQGWRPQAYDGLIKWEETTTINMAVDYGLLDGRIFGSVDVYKKVSEDLINNIQIPSQTNFSNYLTTNIGNVENKGVEFSINGKPVSKADMIWEVGFNATYNKNEITKLTSNTDPAYLGVLTGGISGGVGSTVQIHSVGHPANSFFVYEQVYGDDGNPIEGLYVDRNEDGVINDNDRYHYHDPNSDFYFGINSRFAFKNFSLSFSGRAQFDKWVYNNVSSNNGVLERLYRPEGPYLSNMTSDGLDVMFLTPQYLSDYYVQEASFFRMDDISASYLFEGLFNDKVNLSVIGTINNAFIITDYKGLDPEINLGIDNNLYPRPRVFVLGVNLNF